MEKYKLKKWYPGLPTNTYYAKQDETLFRSMYLFDKQDNHLEIISKNDVINNPEYWEEEKELWQILTFKGTRSSNNGLFTLRSNGGYGWKTWTDEASKNNTLTSCLASQSLEIYSIKRLDDNHIFTVGDVTNRGIITSIVYLENALISKILVYYKDEIGMSSSDLCYKNENEYFLLCKPQEVLTTEDGVKKYIGDSAYGINPSLNYALFVKKFTKKISIDIRYFHDKKAAEKYIIDNKPVLSIEDIKNLHLYTSVDIEKMQDLVKQKLNF